MKKLLLLLIFIPGLALAQVDKGHFIVDIDFGAVMTDVTVKYDGNTVYEGDHREMEGDLRIGYTFIDNLEIGLGLSYANNKIETAGTEETEGMIWYDVFARYYFLKNSNVKPFIGAHFGIRDNASTTAAGYVADTNGIGYGGSLGVVYFLNKHFAVECLYNYQRLDVTGSEDDKIESIQDYGILTLGVLYSF